MTSPATEAAPSEALREGVGLTAVARLRATEVAEELADFRACAEERIRVVHADILQLRRITQEPDRGGLMSARIVLNFEHGLTASAVERRPQGGTFLSLWQPGGVLIVKLSEASLHALWLELSKAVGMLAPAASARRGRWTRGREGCGGGRSMSGSLRRCRNHFRGTRRGDAEPDTRDRESGGGAERLPAWSRTSASGRGSDSG